MTLESDLDVPRNISLKFGQNRPLTAEILPTLSLVWVVGGGSGDGGCGGGGIK